MRVEFEGQETELDKSLLEAVRDPLTHAVRNAVDHGIEPPEQRLKEGKNVEGLVRLRAFQQSGSIRFYSGRLTLRYDVLDPAWLDRAVEHLRSIGRHPYFALDAGEIEGFRTRFAGTSPLGKLDWHPYATYADPFMAIYDPGDRSSTSAPIAIAAMSRRAGFRCDRPQNWPPLLRMK